MGLPSNISNPDSRSIEPKSAIGPRTMARANIERYNRTVRHEWLDQYIIETIEEAQDFATQWLLD